MEELSYHDIIESSHDAYIGSPYIELSTVPGSTASEVVVAPLVGPDVIETSRETRINNTDEISGEFTIMQAEDLATVPVHNLGHNDIILDGLETTASSDRVLRDEVVATPIILDSDDKGIGKHIWYPSTKL